MPRVLQGIGVSSGVVVGQAFLLHSEPLPVVADSVPPERIEAEIEMFRRVLARAATELDKLKRAVQQELGQHLSGIFDAQKLVLDDPHLVDATIQRIRVGRVSARWALKEVVEELTRRFHAVDDEYIREWGGELADLQRRLQRLLRGAAGDDRSLPETGPVIVVAHDAGPSDAVFLAAKPVVGLATDIGGPTSHTAILAHALSLPAVVGLHDISHRVRTGDRIILDGDKGQVILSPELAERQQAEHRRRTFLARESGMAEARELPAVTRDGTVVQLRANIELPSEVDRALAFGAQGIGLYRSEFLFVSRAPRLPSDLEHEATYREICSKVAPHPAVIRTLDLGGEKYFHEVLAPEASQPALGFRGVRLCLRRLDIFLPQLRGLLRAAAAHSNLRILLPLVTAAEEIRQVRTLLAREAAALRAAGHATRADIPVGMMIEVPAAALAAAELAAESDFFSIGTNDLIQYALAVDRRSESLAELYQPTHPGVLRMLEQIVAAAKQHGIPVSLCGEMAAEPRLIPLLLGLGLREFSVQPRAIAGVRDAVRALDIQQARREWLAVIAGGGLPETRPPRSRS